MYNAGTNTPKSVRNVLETVYSMSGQDDAFGQVLAMMQGKETVGEIDCQFMDFEKVEQHFGWSPTHSFEEGIGLTIEWFREYLAEKYPRRSANGATERKAGQHGPGGSP